jgi:hypothetical protein
MSETWVFHWEREALTPNGSAVVFFTQTVVSSVTSVVKAFI